MKIYLTRILALAAVSFLCAMSDYAGTITSVPFVIKKSGTYTLDANLTYSGASNTNAITVEASNVVIDLSGFTLTGTSTTNGIATTTTANVANLTIQDGTITGFFADISLESTQQFLIQNLRLLNQFFGVFATSCSFSTIQNCFVVGKGSTPTGINLQSCSGVVVKSNQISSEDYGCLAQETSGNLFTAN
jgi:Periplasmic copper-binding protein (NosD)